MLLHSCLLFIIGERYRLKSAKKKGTRGKVQEKAGANFQVFLLMKLRGDALNSSSNDV